MVSLQKIIGKNIAAYRKKLGLTQQELAVKLGLDKGSVSRMEVGRTVPRTNTLQKIANVLNVEAYRLLMPPKKKN